MINIRPCADLRNNYNEISKICHETNEPVYITKNGYNDLVILSNEAFENYEEERIDRLVAKHFDKKFPDIESFRKYIYEKIDEALEDIEQGKCRPLEDAIAEWDEKYDLS